MERLEKKYSHIQAAIESLNQVISQHNKWETSLDRDAVEKLGIDYEGIIINLRDSMIQRFEYSIDLLWKYIKTYLEIKLSIVPDVLSPATVVRHAGHARIISENETEALLAMIKKRNLTSHIYQQEIAEILSGEIPTYFKTMQAITSKLHP